MNPSKGAEGAVFASSGMVGFIADIPKGLVSLAVGLIGVALARWVFVNRETRMLQHRQTWRETLPLTLVAMLIASVVIRDRELGLSAAAFTGLGVGWAAVLVLDILGQRVTAMLRAAFGAGPASPDMPLSADHSGHLGRIRGQDVDLPDDMLDKLDKI